MERKLATIQKVHTIELIENADKIEKIGILGWQLVAKKGEFKPEDLCIYCEIDSILPEKPEFEFLRPKHFRIKTMKMRGVISQGIAFPLNILGDDVAKGMLRDYNNGKLNIGLDVTKLMGIIKFEEPISPGQKGNTKGTFPIDIVPKTDEIRIQSVPNVIDEIRGGEIYITTKCDGTSFTGIYLNGEFRVCSRNQELLEGDEDVYWRIAHKLDLKDRLKRYDGNVAIQGEICGKGIQKNRLNLNEDKLFVFNIYDIDAKKYLGYKEFNRVIKVLELESVPIVSEYIKSNFSLEEYIEMAKGKYYGTNNNREGIVVRPVVEIYSETLQGRMSFKVINNEYLLKEEK